MEKRADRKFSGRHDQLTNRILASAYDVHSRLGPGLLESAYKSCIVYSLQTHGLHVHTEVPISLQFDGLTVPTAYRADVIVENRVLLELKATENLLAIHCAQARTYLNHSNGEVALLINFNVRSLVDGIRRFDRRASRLEAPGTPLHPLLPTLL